MRPVTDTLRLIRLLDGTLPADDGAELREELASDDSLRQEWRRINSILSRPVASERQNEADPLEDAEELAAVIEAQNDVDHDFADDEHLVYELASLDRWQWGSEADDGPVPAAIRDRMASVVLGHIQQSRSGSGPVVTRATSQRKRAHSPTQQRTTKAQPTVRTTAHRHGKHDQRRVAFLVTAAACIVLLAALGWQTLWNLALPERPEIENVAEGTNQREGSMQPPVDAPAQDSGTVDSPRQSPEEFETPSQLVHQAPSEMIDIEHEPFPAPPMEPLIVVRQESIEWRQIVGIVVESVAGDGEWSGVFAAAKPAVSQAQSAMTVTTYRSLSQSWGRGETASGIEFTLGSETTAAISTEVAERQSVSVQIDRGLLAVGGLSRDAVVRCESPALAIDVHSLQDGSRIAFILSGPTPGLLVLEGEVSVGDLVATAPTSVEWPEDEEPRLTSTVRPLEWLTPPRPPAEQEWLNACLAETDVVSTLLRTDGVASARTLAAAVDWSISLDATRALPLAAASNASEHREAALTWLSDAQFDADTRRAVLSGLRPLLAESDLDVAHWFEIARGEADVTPEVLQELALGVGRSEPLFVRHAAIRFLREATRQRFASYDTESPTPAAVAEIRTFVRQMTQPASRPQRGRP